MDHPSIGYNNRATPDRARMTVYESTLSNMQRGYKGHIDSLAKNIDSMNNRLIEAQTKLSAVTMDYIRNGYVDLYGLYEIPCSGFPTLKYKAYFRQMAKEYGRPFVYIYNNHGITVPNRRFCDKLTAHFHFNEGVTFNVNTVEVTVNLGPAGGATSKSLMDQWKWKCANDPEWRHTLRLDKPYNPNR